MEVLIKVNQSINQLSDYFIDLAFNHLLNPILRPYLTLTIRFLLKDKSIRRFHLMY